MSKTDPYLNYWIECVAVSLEENGVSATKEQIEAIARDVRCSHEMYGEAFGYTAIPNPLEGETKRLARELRAEKEKVICGECKGAGSLISYGPYHSFESSCWKCNGEGRHAP